MEKEFNFTERQLKPIEEWCNKKDTDMPSDEWEIAYFLDGYNFGIEKLTQTKKLLVEAKEVIQQGYDNRFLNKDQYIKYVQENCLEWIKKYEKEDK